MIDDLITAEQAQALLDGASPGPWKADGDPWNRIVWSSADNRVCFMAHSSGLNDDRDIATSNLVAAAPDLARTVITQAAEVTRLWNLDAEYGAIEAAIIMADPAFDGDSNHPTPKDRLLASIARLRTQVEADDWAALLVEAHAEALKAMRKFPQPNYVISKFAEESGEVVKAAIHCAEGRETADNLRAEMRQTIAMLYRLWVEGDAVHGLPPVRSSLTAYQQAKEGKE